jgi:hypothetical protein
MAFTFYLAMCFLTNSYINEYRMDDWIENDHGKNKSIHSMDCWISGHAAALLWPVYWTSRLSTYVVKEAPKVKIYFGDCSEEKVPND